MKPRFLIPSLYLALTLAGSVAKADIVHQETVIINGAGFEFLCVGFSCSDGEPRIAGEEIKLSTISPDITFDDTSADTNSNNEWQLRANDLNANNFVLRDLTSGSVPFGIDAGNVTGSLWVGSGGALGLGTTLPQAELHIANHNPPAIRLQQLAGLGAMQQSWEVQGHETGFAIADITHSSIPMFFETEAPNFSVFVDDEGNVGFGTGSPNAPLHLVDHNSFTYMRLSALAAANQSVDITFTAGPLGTGQLRYNIVDGDNQEMSLDADGNLVIDGTLTTTGPTCSGGCDQVFDAEYPRLSITEHAQAMWANGHLPQVGPTFKDAPVNVTAKMGGMLNELEHAHIYIDELNAKISEQGDQIARLLQVVAALQSDVEALSQ